MFVILYEFHVKKNQQDRFQQLWETITVRTNELSASLGSRLHQLSETEWVGYSQWPTKESWETSHLESQEMVALRMELTEVCEKIQIVYQMDVVKDLFLKAT